QLNAIIASTHFPTRRSSDLLPGGPRNVRGFLSRKSPMSGIAPMRSEQMKPFVEGTLEVFESMLRVRLNESEVELKNASLSFRRTDRKSTRLNSSHVAISYAV